MTQCFPESPATNRFEKVDLLTLIDPHWLENSQAAKLIRMVAENDRDDQLAQRHPTTRRETVQAA